jgi:hypothetical protein
MTRARQLFLVLTCTLACAAGGAWWQWPTWSSVRTEDQNHDGQADVWRTYDAEGRLSRVAIDTNFDGRSDVHEYYQRGVLVRRDSDRDFDDRVDLVEDFDPATREHTRSVVDVDDDGTADLLVLFQNRQPVFTAWTHSAVAVAPVPYSGLSHAVAQRSGADELRPLADPFRSAATVRSVLVRQRAGVGLSTSGGLPSATHRVHSSPVRPSDVVGSGCSKPASIPVGSRPSRGPPVLPLA